MVDSSDYPLWHGTLPMGPFLRERLDSDRFLVRGEGVRVRDASGRWFIDARSSCWNMALGYGARDVKEAIRRQLEELPYATLLAYDRPGEVTVRYARALSEAFGPDLPFVRLGSGGSQMTETAVLLSRFVRTLQGTPERTGLVSFEGSYHGMGPGATAFSGFVAPHNASGPLLPDVHFASPVGSWTENVRRLLEGLSPERVTAVIVEPQMGSMGVIPSAGDLLGLAALCRETGVHFIADEVSTGFGRTGAMSRCVDIGIWPDLLVLGKALTAGYVPAAALLISRPLYEAAYEPDPPRFLTVGSTNDGHPVAAAAGLAVLEVYERDGILEHVRTTGAFLQERLRTVQEKRTGTEDVAGAGLMLRFTLRGPSGEPWPMASMERFRLACEDNGLLLSLAMGGAWVVPPLVVTEDECEEIAAAVDAALDGMEP